MFFSLSYDSLLLLPPPTHYTSMASRSPRLVSLARRAFSSSSSHANGVSLVQGASRGIGLEFVKQLLENNDKGHVVATCRNPNASTGLLHLKDRFDDRLEILPLDLTVESSIELTWIIERHFNDAKMDKGRQCVIQLEADVESCRIRIEFCWERVFLAFLFSTKFDSHIWFKCNIPSNRNASNTFSSDS